MEIQKGFKNFKSKEDFIKLELLKESESEKNLSKLNKLDNEYSIYIKNRFKEFHLAYQKAGILSETKEDLIFE